MRKRTETELLLEEYENRFLMGFPTHFFLDYTKEELIRILKECLDNNEPIADEFDDGLIY